MKTQVIILYKGFNNNPKSRLSAVLSYEERVLLSVFMLYDILTVMHSFADEVELSVLTNDGSIEHLVHKFGFTTIPDNFNDINLSLNYYAQYLVPENIDSLLVLPSDIPLVRRQDIEAILKHKKAGISLVPAKYDQGTNALLSYPPNGIEFRYGKNSSQEHIQNAKERGLDCRKLNLNYLMYDIDRPNDLRWLLANSNSNRTSKYLRTQGISQRLLVPN